MKYITTPIYYANDKPHIGHAVTTLSADVLNRAWKQQGQETFFLTGLDEHGAKIAQAAKQAGQEPQLFVNDMAQAFESAWQALHIHYDGFIRTTDPQHQAYVATFLQQLYDTGAIYQGVYKGWYCVGCEEFKTTTQIGPGNTCPLHKTVLVEVEEETYLFRLSEYQNAIREYIESDRLIIRPEGRRNEVLRFIEQEGLRDIAIARKNVAWGIPLPWDPSHTVYVWVDALLNYLSASDPSGPAFKSGRKPTFPPTLQLIAKDILRFHAVIWPGLLLAADKPLPHELLVHGYYTNSGQKMSKSLGNVITPGGLIDRYGVDGVRYLLIKTAPFENDADISWEQFDRLFTSDLANNLGNLVNRVQTMLQKYCEGRVPEAAIAPEHQAQVKQLIDSWQQALTEKNNFVLALNNWQAGLNWANTLIDQEKPWQLAKDNQTARLEAVLATLAETIFVAGYLIAPVLPQTGQKILSLFGTSEGQVAYDTLSSTNHTGGRVIQPIAPLFPRLEPSA